MDGDCHCGCLRPEAQLLRGVRPSPVPQDPLHIPWFHSQAAGGVRFLMQDSRRLRSLARSILDPWLADSTLPVLQSQKIKKS